MMKQKAMGLMMMAATVLSAHALTLEEARRLAHDNYPAIRQYRLLAQSRDFTLSNVAKGWWPKVSASAGTYAFTAPLKQNVQMEAMEFSMKNWMASGSVTVSQRLYDGGQTAAQRRVVSAQNDVQQRQLDVSMYAVNERIDQLFFGILLLDAQLRQNGWLQEDLENSEQTVKSMMDGGLANPGDLDALLVERLKAKQQQEALVALRRSYLRMLGVLVGKTLAENEPLEKPAVAASGSRMVNRPELSYYASQNLLIDAQRRQLDSQLRPTVSLFGTGLVHTKVGDLLNNGLLMGGVNLSWNVGALYTRKNDIRKLETQRAMNDSQRETFLFQNRLQNEEADGRVESLRRQMVQDAEIVRLRERIRLRTEKKVQLGTERVSELVRDIHAVSLARVQQEQHEIELLKEIYGQKTLNNE